MALQKLGKVKPSIGMRFSRISETAMWLCNKSFSFNLSLWKGKRRGSCLKKRVNFHLCKRVWIFKKKKKKRSIQKASHHLASTREQVFKLVAKHEKHHCWGVHPRTPTPDGGSLFSKTDLPFQFAVLSSVVKRWTESDFPKRLSKKQLQSYSTGLLGCWNFSIKKWKHILKRFFWENV